MNEIVSNVNKIFKDYDKDGNGTLNRKEARLFIKDLFKMMGKPISSQGEIYVIEMLDQNNDGIISKAELIKMLSANSQPAA